MSGMKGQHNPNNNTSETIKSRINNKLTILSLMYDKAAKPDIKSRIRFHDTMKEVTGMMEDLNED